MADASDFRIKTSFFGHWKTHAVEARHGGDGVLSLVRLWAYAAANKPSGDLSGMRDLEIVAAAKYPRADGEAWLATLAEVRFVDGETGCYTLHDWAEHQPWAAAVAARSTAARHNAHKRWVREGKGHQRTEWCDDRCVVADAKSTVGNAKEASGIAKVPSGIAPTPAPDPAPDPAPIPKKEDPWKEQVEQVAAHFAKVHPTLYRQAKNTKARKIIRARLADDDYTTGQLCEAIDANARDPWHAERGKFDLDYVLRDAAHVDRFLTLAAKSKPASATPASEDENARRLRETGTGEWNGKRYLNGYEVVT
jgi:hypothetical protein